MANRLLVGIMIIALVIGGLFLLGYIPLGDDNSANMEIIFYDVDGNELGRTNTLSLFGIQQPGIEGDIHSLDVVVYFKVTTNIDYESILSACLLTITTSTNMGAERSEKVHEVSEHILGVASSDLEGSFSDTYLMSDLLPESAITAEGKENGWLMKFAARVGTYIDVTIPTGEPDAEDTCGTTLTLNWVADEVPSVSVDSWFGDW